MDIIVVIFNTLTSKASLYINGNFISDSSSFGAATLGVAAIGKYPTSSYLYPFQGIIDEVHIYNRALSQAEIKADFNGGPDFSPYLLANVPQGATQVITTLSWQGTGSINVTITTPSQTYTESMMSKYQKTTYSTTGGPLSMLNIKRLSISVNALPSAQSWNITLTYDNTVSAYQISVETQ